MAKLTDDVKRFIVEQIACYRTPSQVVEAVKKQFGLTIDRRQVEDYDPAKPRMRAGRAGKTPAQKWCDIHATTRQRFLAECGQQPIAQQGIRLRELQRIFELEEMRQNTVGQRQTLEQAAKESGGAFTNKRELTGANGAPIAMALEVRFVRPAVATPIIRADAAANPPASTGAADAVR